MKSININISNIKKSQKEYLELIKSFENQVFSKDISQYEIVMILDEIQSFWFNRKNILNIELDELVLEKDSVILSGAIYLNIEDNEHYKFKALGAEHIISDPLLKLEHFFRVPFQIFNEESVKIFKRAFLDTLNILSQTDIYFYILPIKLIVVENEKEHLELLQKFFLNFINSSFNEEFMELNDFFDNYATYDEIEKSMTPSIRDSLTFDEGNDSNLTLEEKINSYFYSQNIVESFIKDKIESEKFIFALWNYISQIIGILTISIQTGLIPFIRHKPTFQYLTIVMYTFIEDEYFKNMIEKSIVYYIFYNTVAKERLIEIDFEQFVDFVQKNKFLDVFIEKMKIERIDIFKGGVNEVGKIIEEEFCVKIDKFAQSFEVNKI